MSPEGEILTSPVGYVPDAGEFASFLECGNQAFRTLNKLN
jgi:hypothetical protein